MRGIPPDRGAKRGLLLAAAMFALAACGWHPVYAPIVGPSSGHSALDRIDVAIIPERQGQLLRQALQARLQRGDSAPPPEYSLEAAYAISQEGLGIMPDSSVTRLRLIATSSFVLRALADQRSCVSGNVRVVDGFDAENQQFFASDLEAETVQRRLAKAVADQIVLKLARAFDSPGQAGCEGR